jgi:hypothetical protein
MYNKYIWTIWIITLYNKDKNHKTSFDFFGSVMLLSEKTKLNTQKEEMNFVNLNCRVQNIVAYKNQNLFLTVFLIVSSSSVEKK